MGYFVNCLFSCQMGYVSWYFLSEFGFASNFRNVFFIVKKQGTRFQKQNGLQLQINKFKTKILLVLQTHMMILFKKSKTKERSRGSFRPWCNSVHLSAVCACEAIICPPGIRKSLKIIAKKSRISDFLFDFCIFFRESGGRLHAQLQPVWVIPDTVRVPIEPCIFEKYSFLSTFGSIPSHSELSNAQGVSVNGVHFSQSKMDCVCIPLGWMDSTIL